VRHDTDSASTGSFIDATGNRTFVSIQMRPQVVAYSRAVGILVEKVEVAEATNRMALPFDADASGVQAVAARPGTGNQTESPITGS
jgi:hypothetical protein